MVEEALLAVRGAGAVAAIVLLAWSVGLVAGCAWSQSWKVVTRGHFRIVSWCALSIAILATLAGLSATGSVAGSTDGGSTQPLFAGLFTASVLVYLIAQYQLEDGVAAILGAVA
ncbi:MAG: hypothetical protein QOG16_1608, partial [Actinomycetota bacterium]|nr:hypothetical protein [Actinomycetota bacterium]